MSFESETTTWLRVKGFDSNFSLHIIHHKEFVQFEMRIMHRGRKAGIAESFPYQQGKQVDSWMIDLFKRRFLEKLPKRLDELLEKL